MKTAKGCLDVNLDELDRVLDGAKQAPLSDDDHGKLKGALHAVAALLAQSRNNEKTSAVLERTEKSEADRATPKPGHGRNGAEEFTGARKVPIAHQKLRHGERCPGCGKGNVYG